MVQYTLLAIAVGVLEGVWLYFSLEREDRPDFGILARRESAPVTARPVASPFLATENQLA